IADWQECLELATGFYELTDLGFLGVDLVLDKYRGPMMLELNARPGLNIQIANNDGMLRRARILEQKLAELDLESKLPPAQERVEFAKHWFAAPDPPLPVEPQQVAQSQFA